ncbi:helix-turn-helix domain-containing protein [Methylobacterium sp. JK268]
MLQYGRVAPASGLHGRWPAASATARCELTLGRITPVGRVDHVSAGAPLYAEGDTSEFVYGVVSGVVRTVSVGLDGKRVVRGFYLSGELFGMERARLHASSAEAISDTRVVRCSRLRFDALAASDAQVASELWSWLLQMTERAEDLSVLGRASAAQKLAYFLTDLACRVSAVRRIELPMSRTDIGDFLGLSSETVSRTFTTLRRVGLIATHGRYVTLLDPGALRRMSGSLVNGD